MNCTNTLVSVQVVKTVTVNLRGWTRSSPGDKKFTHKFGEETVSKVATWNTKCVGERK